jgi:hypothetical protein
MASFKVDSPGEGEGGRGRGTAQEEWREIQERPRGRERDCSVQRPPLKIEWEGRRVSWVVRVTLRQMEVTAACSTLSHIPALSLWILRFYLSSCLLRLSGGLGFLHSTVVSLRRLSPPSSLQCPCRPHPGSVSLADLLRPAVTTVSHCLPVPKPTAASNSDSAGVVCTEEPVCSREQSGSAGISPCSLAPQAREHVLTWTGRVHVTGLSWHSYATRVPKTIPQEESRGQV